MRKLIIPSEEINSISLAQITSNFNGLIFVKQKEELCGVIMYNGNDEEWFFSRHINTDEQEFCEENLYELIARILKFDPSFTFVTT